MVIRRIQRNDVESNHALNETNLLNDNVMMLFADMFLFPILREMCM